MRVNLALSQKVSPKPNKSISSNPLQIPIYLSHPLFYINKRLRKQQTVEKHALENSPIDKISNILYNVVTNPKIKWKERRCFG